MHNDGEKANVVEECESRGKGLEMLCDNRASDFDNGELLRRHRAKMG
jgi:hypothetical protein